MPIGSGAQFTSTSDARTQSLLDNRSTPWINASQFSQAIFQASVTDPWATFRRAGHPDVSYQVPNGVRPANGSDAQLDIVDPTGHFVDESWATTGANPTWSTGYHVRNDLYGPGVGAGGVRAYGGSAIGGLIRSWEAQAGSISHALAIGIDGFQLKRGFVWPATAEDGDAASSYAGGTPMGTLAAIPSNVNLNSLGLSPGGLVLARALQNYGAYVVDRSGCVCLYAEPGLENAPSLADMRHDFTALRGLLRVVSNNGPWSVGGGGTPIARVAPPLG
jgi:hypothetical protein